MERRLKGRERSVLRLLLVIIVVGLLRERPAAGGGNRVVNSGGSGSGAVRLVCGNVRRQLPGRHGWGKGVAASLGRELVASGCGASRRQWWWWVQWVERLVVVAGRGVEGGV